MLKANHKRHDPCAPGVNWHDWREKTLAFFVRRSKAQAVHRNLARKFGKEIWIDTARFAAQIPTFSRAPDWGLRRGQPNPLNLIRVMRRRDEPGPQRFWPDSFHAARLKGRVVGRTVLTNTQIKEIPACSAKRDDGADRRNRIMVYAAQIASRYARALTRDCVERSLEPPVRVYGPLRPYTDRRPIDLAAGCLPFELDAKRGFDIAKERREAEDNGNISNDD